MELCSLTLQRRIKVTQQICLIKSWASSLNASSLLSKLDIKVHESWLLHWHYTNNTIDKVQLFENYPKCLIWIFNFGILHYLSGNTVLTASFRFSKTRQNASFLALLSSFFMKMKLASLAMLNETFWVIFKHCAISNLFLGHLKIVVWAGRIFCQLL